jgi:predicted DCC family thiol-disulfide oxidoreductase YuxK
LYPALIWVKILRPLVLAAVVGLHVGIAVVSPGLAEFTLIMLAANLAFVSGPWVRGLVTGLHQPGLTVLYDGACPRCRKTMALVTAADPDHVIEPVDLMAVDVSLVHPSLAREKCLQSMHVVAANGQITAGFDAVRTLTGRVPLFWPLAAIACLPGLAWLGRRVYNVIAANRPRDVLCTDEVCGIHSRTLRMVPRNQDLAQ